jgi:predicted Rossmann-fold nucleotide-binding protein
VARIQVAVIGSGAPHERRAEEVGRLLAARGATVVCGGLDEVMTAAARGAKAEAWSGPRIRSRQSSSPFVLPGRLWSNRHAFVTVL